MSWCKNIVLAVLIPAAAAVSGAERNPHIGYLYPAGGRRGSETLVVAGGQFLKNATAAYISGSGVSAVIIQSFVFERNIYKEQQELLARRLDEVRDKRLAEAGFPQPRKPAVNVREPAAGSDPKPAANAKDTKREQPVKLPDHPVLYDLDNKSLRELAHIKKIFSNRQWRVQYNRQLSEMVLLKITISPDAAPGDRELRLQTPAGLTNPMIFQVGTLPEIRECEPNDTQAYPKLPGSPGAMSKEKPLELPIMLSGQIMPGDIDRFRFCARQGQQIVFSVAARSLIPYLSDAVPGWFQAVLTLYDADGNELAFAAAYRNNPDPVLLYRIPKDGEYELSIRDAIYRGREDFVYRIAAGEQPFIVGMFPLGGRVNALTVATIGGWNLPARQLTLDTNPDGSDIRQVSCGTEKLYSNVVSYTVDTLPECDESEPNDNAADAQHLQLPKIINGRIGRPGDVDVFRLEGRAGDEVVMEVVARRLNSPLDSFLRLTDAAGKTLHYNDDYTIKEGDLYKEETGLITHQADSYLMIKLPETGVYYVYLSDAQNHGGEDYAYRLRLSAPLPDYALRVTPSSLNFRAGGDTIPICVQILRKDGFNGAIAMSLQASPGFTLSGGLIPAGCNRLRMTMTAPLKGVDRPVSLRLQGCAVIDGRAVSRPALPADDMMQAFLYRHLVPVQELMAVVLNSKWGIPPTTLAGDEPILIPFGGEAKIRFNTRRGQWFFRELQLELDGAPPGLTIREMTPVSGGVEFRLKADKSLPIGFSDNIIIGAFKESVPKNSKPGARKQRVSIGMFPAIPIEVVRP